MDRPLSKLLPGHADDACGALLCVRSREPARVILRGIALYREGDVLSIKESFRPSLAPAPRQHDQYRQNQRHEQQHQESHALPWLEVIVVGRPRLVHQLPKASANQGRRLTCH